MPSERVQRQINRLLDEAEQAVAASDWPLVQARCAQVLALEPGNGDAIAYRDAAARAIETAAEPSPAPEPPAPEPPPLPAAFAGGRFQVQALLGEGGRKVVYRAYDTRLDREVAFSLIKTAGLDAGERERVTREARTLGRLSGHPNVVTVFEIGDTGGPGSEAPRTNAQPYLVSELLSGGDLAQLIRQAPEHRLPLQQAIAIARGIAEGLAFAHGKGVVHRDLKPGNVWLGSDGTPKLGDFGLALSGADPHLTNAGMMVGTALYMAPEQALGGEVTYRSDLYSLGCVLYELVTGRTPFAGDDSVAVIGQHLNSTPVMPSWHRPDCPPTIEALVMRLLDKDPAGRPATAQEVVDALRTASGVSVPVPLNAGETERSPAGPHSNPVYRRSFVGREAEMRQIEEAFDAAASGDGRMVMVVGEPGIGKTTLTEQLATYTALRGGRMLVGHCYEEGSLSLPYLPFVESLRSYVQSSEAERLREELGSAAPDVARIVSEVRDRLRVEPSAPSPDPSEDRYRLLSSVAGFLRKAAAAQPLAIVVEDLHDADRGTLELLSFIARNLAGSRLLVVGTYRDVEVDRSHPLSATLAELRRLGSFSRVVLRGLTAGEVQRMIAAIAGQEIPYTLAEGVFRQTEGNPLFVQEVVRDLAEEGLITRVDGRWRVNAPLLERIPEGLRDVIGKRLARLSRQCNQLLALGAVIGRDFQLSTLVAVAGEPEETVAELLDAAVKVAVLQEQARGGSVQYRFAHAFFRQTLYDELSAPRRIRIHQQVARALEAQYSARLEEHATELAEHFAHSSSPDDLEKAVHYGRVAADRASAVFAHGEAVRLLRQAIEVHEVLAPDDRPRRCALLLELAGVMLIAGDLRELVDEVAPRAAQLAEDLGDLEGASQACVVALQAQSRYGGAAQRLTPENLAWTDRLDRLAPPGTKYRARADANRAAQLMFAEQRYAEAWTLRQQALALARSLGDLETLANAAYGVVLVDGRPVEWAERLAVAREFAWLADHLELESARWLAFGTGGLFLTAGDCEQSTQVWGKLRRYIERSGDRRMLFWSFPTTEALQEGHLEEALAICQSMIQLGEELGSPVTGMLVGTLYRVYPLLMLGRPDEVIADAERPNRMAGARPFQSWLTAIPLALAHAGRREEAATALAPWRTLLLEGGDEPGEAQLGQALWAAVENEDIELAGLLLERLAPIDDYDEGVLRYGAVVARILGRLAELKGDRDEAKARYAQALRVATRCRLRTEIALTRLQLAELLLSGDGTERAEAAPLLTVVIPELEAMKMAPALERARAAQTALLRAGSPSAAETGRSPAPGPDGAGDHTARRVFISYASEDRPRAVALAEQLEAAGLTVWIDHRSIGGGAGWSTEIVRGIKRCAVFIVLGSARAFGSPNVQRELNLAVEENRPVLPLLLEGATPTDEVRYALAGRQWLQLLDQPAAVWLPRVLTAIEQLA